MNRRGFLGALLALPLLRLFKKPEPVRIGWAGNLSAHSPNIEEAMNAAWRSIAAKDGSPDLVLVNPEAYRQLLSELTPRTAFGDLLHARARAFRKLVDTRRTSTGYAAWAEAA